MSVRPRILITTRARERKGKQTQFMGELHLRLIGDAGGLPLPVVIAPGIEDHLETLLEMADGVLVTEGGDLGEELRGPIDPETLDEPDPLKDSVEAYLMRATLERDMPTLGICRGAELMNVLLGGELYDHLPRALGDEVLHIDWDNYHGHRHPITLTPGTPLAEIYPEPRLDVTSYHHQGVRVLARSLEPMAAAPDGLIEAFRHPGRRFAWGLQFHPERQQGEHPGHSLIHRALVDAARGARPA